MFVCDGKIAFITGALGVIGKAYTKYLMENHIKAVILVDIANLCNTYEHFLNITYGKSRYFYIQTDVSKKSELRSAFETVVQHFGQLDIVINNAGIGCEDNYDLCLQVNFMAVLNGTMMALQEYLPKYKENEGVIVNTSSVAGVVTFAHIPIYSLSKHAITAIGTCFRDSDECLKQNIRILTICPVATPSPVLWAALKTLTTEGKENNIPITSGADYLGEGLIEMLKNGTNGAAWVFNEGKSPLQINYSSIHQEVTDYQMAK